ALGQAEQVVIVPGIAANRLACLLERLNLGVDGKHLFHEGPPEMQQPHLEWPFVVGSETHAGFLEKLPDVRLEPYALGWLPAAGGAGLNEDAVADVAGPREALDILEAVVAAEAADGLAFLLDEFQARMPVDDLPQLLQLAVNRVLAQGRVEGGRVQEDVDVFGKPLYQVPALRQAGAALEDDLAARRLLDDAQGLGAEVI